MPLNIDLVSDCGVILELDASPYGINPTGGTLGSVDLGSQYTNVWQRGWRPLTSQNYGNREIELSIQLRGTSHDDLHSNYRQVAQVLAEAATYHITGGRQGAAAYLCVQLPGATNTTTYDVVMGEVPVAPVFSQSVQNTANPYMLTVPVRLTLKPWGHVQALTRASQVVEANGGNSSTVLPNDQVLTVTPSSAMTRETPVRLTFQHTSGASGLSWATGLLIARRSIGNVDNWTPHIQAELSVDAGTASNYSVLEGPITSGDILSTAVASAQGGWMLKIWHNALTNPVSGVLETVTLTRNISDMAGRHRVYLTLNGGNVATADITSMQLTYGGVSGDAFALSSVPVGVGAPRKLYMGIMEIPADPLLQSFKWQAHYKIPARLATANYRFDNWTLVPIDEQVFHTSMGGGAAIWASQQMVIDGLGPYPQVNLLDSSGDVAVSSPLGIISQPSQGFTIPPRKTKFLALSGTSNSTYEFRLTADYYTYTDWLL